MEVLDLSFIQIFPNGFGNNPVEKDQLVNPMPNPLAHTKILNLTGSVLNIENPMDFLNLSQMPELEILKLGQVIKLKDPQ